MTDTNEIINKLILENKVLIRKVNTLIDIALVETPADIDKIRGENIKMQCQINALTGFVAALLTFHNSESYKHNVGLIIEDSNTYLDNEKVTHPYYEDIWNGLLDDIPDISPK